MRYVGGKARMAKYLLPVMVPYRKIGQTWVEPFVGGGSVFERVENPRIGADINKYIVALLSAVRDGWVPPDCTREEYCAITQNKNDYEPALVGLVGFCYSFRGKFFAGYFESKNPKRHGDRAGQIKCLLKTAPKLKGSVLLHCDYRDLEIPSNSIIYCDPPYAETLSYKATFRFDSDEFWRWTQTKAKQGHTVFVSEYKAPDWVGATCVLEKDRSVKIAHHVNNKRRRVSEKLFLIG